MMNLFPLLMTRILESAKYKRAIINIRISVFLYVKTDKGEYIIPLFSSLGVHNKYHEDKIELP